uniref:YgiT-type zinc finger domain-containing protein n=1 Tax=Candidatus Kentrum sp. FM TaxID=2126340 RepID=A0A450VWN3_9GAMM|nr:MAG: YgiT-type zinc finger domain-containing protein [Candidatus Kentron sp. FM]VFJ55180.1 MAG: YgiT-type zinc finger domain-containing protein [Candidatus Kentron sp. FM]VFK09218.1 MAG: YgiT-type zinc finger domain-containing protein [Candidatus Kentron sp. FM]
MKPFEKCPVCGGDLENKRVEKILRGAGNTASIRVFAQVCLHCEERLYSEEVVKSFDDIRGKLQRKEFSYFRTLGQSFTVHGNWANEAIQPAARP